MATYNIVATLLNNSSLFDVLLKGGSGSGLSSFSITNSDGTVTTFTGSNLTWSGTSATGGTVSSIVRQSADGTITYDQITGFTGGVNDAFTAIWNPGTAAAGSGQVARAGFIFSGADTVNGSSGNDSTLRGYNGADTFNGGIGNDQVAFDNDAAAGGGGAIIVNMSASTQRGVAASSARDGFGSIDSLNSIEEARGGATADFFFGSTTYNFFSGRGGADTYDGGNTVAFFKNVAVTLWNWADYRLEGGASGINITLTNGTATPGIDGVGDTGGTGTDTFGATETFTNINSIRGSNAAGAAGNDTVTGNDFFNHFEGLAGADTFDGNGGSDRYSYNNEFRFGGSTTRGVVVNLSDNAVVVNSVNVAAHTGIDTFNGATGFVDTLIDVEEINATNQDDTIYGSQFDNKFFLFNGNDTVILGGGFDYVEPGAGNDVIDGSAGPGLDQSYEDRDEVSYDDFGTNGVGVYIDLNSSTLVDPTGGIDTITDIERLRGTSSADTLIGSDNANQREELYRGLGGNDIIDGRNGYDVADYTQDANNGGAGGIIANLSSSAITVGAFTVQGGTVRDGFGNTDSLFYVEGIRGTAGNDTMVGNDGNNQFRTMGGTDTIDGGVGIDTLELYYGDFFTGLGGIANLGSTDFVFGGHTVAANTARQFDGGIVTMTSIEVVGGSYANDGINGSEARESINGFLGDDTIFGNGGDDIINGFQGANTLDGGNGFDTVSFMYDKTQGDYLAANYPGNGFVVWGGVTVNLGTNSATGFDGLANVITNFEAVTGTFANDTLTGDGNDNSFRGLRGNDTINGAGGNDTVNYSPTNQDGRLLVPIIGVNYSEPNVVRVNLTGGALTLGGISVAAGTALDGDGGTDTLSSIENVTGSIGGDFIAASLVANVIDGWTGDDVVVYAGVQGDYTITTVNGGWQVVRNAAPADSDTLINVETLSFTGGGTLSLAAQGLTESGGAQGDELTGVQGADTLDGGGGSDFIDGGQGNDDIAGGTGADELLGGDGNDVVNGGADNDTIIGGSGHGDDTYIGGDGVDTVVYTSAIQGIVVHLVVPGNPGGGAGTATGVDIDTDQLTSIENVVGGQGADSITGDGQANNLQGVAGADQLFGEGGSDTLQGGSGNDTLVGGGDNDFLYGDSDDDTLQGGAGDDLLDGGANSFTGGDAADFSDATGSVVAALGADGDAVVTAAGIGTDTLIRIENLTGGSSNDTLTGNAFSNVLHGEAGNDRLIGGLGNDTLSGGLKPNPGFDPYGTWGSGVRPSDRIGDFNGDGRADVIQLHENGNAYVWTSNGSGLNAYSMWSSGVRPTDQLGDFNGDGRTDIIQIREDGTAHVSTSNGSAFNSENAWGSGMRQSDRIGDFNGDGRADIIQLHENGNAYVWTSNGSGFNAYSVWATGVRPTDQIGDFNGDGRADIIQLHENGNAYVWTSNGSGFNAYSVWATGVRPTDQIGDFNGDGRADIIQLHENGNAYVWTSNGSGFNPYSIWGTGVRPTDKLGDFNGDGRTDVIQLHENGNAYVWTSNGAAFDPYVIWGSGVRPGDQIGDFNGDGSDDVIQLLENGTALVSTAHARAPDDDVFVFGAGFGNDTITDFEEGVGDGDVIEFSSAVFVAFSDVLVHTADDGLGNTTINDGAGNTLMLLGVVKANLAANDFHFV